MPHKRKQIRKLKKTLAAKAAKRKQATTSNDAKQPSKQLPNQDMLLKLMAMFGNKPGAQPSMDPAKFLEQQEKKAERDNEIRRLKLQERQVKSDNAAANQQHNLDLARLGLQDAERKAKNEQELLTIEKERKGIQGGIKSLNMQIAQARHKIKMNTKNGDLEADRAKRDELKRSLKEIKSNINYLIGDALTADEMAVFRHMASKIEDGINALNGLEKALRDKKDVSRKHQLINKLADELETGLSDLLDINQRLKFDIKQEEDTIDIANDRIKTYNELKKENTKLEHERRVKKRAADIAGVISNRDLKTGKPIPVYNESLLKHEVKPEDAEEVQKYMQEGERLMNYLKGIDARHTVKDDVWWYTLDTERSDLCDFISTDFYSRFSVNPRWTTLDGATLTDLNDIIVYLRHLRDKHTNAMAKAQEEYVQAVEHNNKIRALPKVVKTEVTEDVIAELKERGMNLREEVEDQQRRGEYNKKSKHEWEDLIRRNERLQAELNASTAEDLTDDQLEAIAKLKKEHEEIERQLNVKRKQKQRVERVEDETADMEFNNAVTRAGLADSPKTKKTKEEAQERAIQARKEAEKQNELNEARKMTYKAEQDKRLAEMEANAAHSEKIQKLDDEILEAKAKGEVADMERERQEALSRARQDTQNKMIARDVRRTLNAYARSASGSAIQDMTVTLTAMGDAIDRQTAEHERREKELKPYLERFERYPEQFTAFNRTIADGTFKGFENVNALHDATDSLDKLQQLKDFFGSWDRGEISMDDGGDDGDPW